MKCEASGSVPFVHRDSRRHSRGTPRGQPRREEACRREQHGRGQQDSRVRGTDFKSEQRQPAPEHERTDRPGEEARSEHDAGLSQHHQAYPSGRCAKGDPDPDFPGALPHRVGDDTVQTQCRKQQSHAGERRHQDERKPRATRTPADDVRHRGRSVHDQLRVKPGDGLAHLGENMLGRPLGCDNV